MSLTVSARDWDAYIKRLAALNEAAAEKMREYVRENGFGDMNALIDYAYALVTRYGEGSAALSAAMYDAVAEMSGKLFDPAVPAETADYQTVARTVQGVAKASQSPDAMGSAVGRMVKQAGADTTLQNALRDGAEFAWVPHGDTCAFCITLASRGWQRASQKAVKGGHAEHIHNNCDCTYAIRFDGKGGVAGYDPEKYRAMYDAAEGDTSQEKINAMRRAQYAEDKDEINARKRAAYAERKEREKGLPGSRESGIINTGGIKGALDPDSVRAQEHADRYYEEVRHMTTDVHRIAENTGFSEERIQEIKDYIFVEQHDLGGKEKERFDSSYQMAESWQRLIEGKNIQPHDLTLLRHEMMERALVASGMAQSEAHTITSMTYNYGKEAHEFYDKNHGNHQER